MPACGVEAGPPWGGGEAAWMPHSDSERRWRHRARAGDELAVSKVKVLRVISDDLILLRYISFLSLHIR